MSEWLDGLSMAWGMFLAIPCPLRRWNERAREKMLACLPLVGLVVGLLWALCALLLRQAPAGVYASCMAALPWAATGFLHLDGFMDVCDAVLSRRDLETRQRILKDSRCGAFAVICMVLLALAQWSAFLERRGGLWWTLALVPVCTRACAGLAVLCLRPLGTSQYAAMPARRGGYAVALGLVLALCVGMALLCGGSAAPLCAAAGYGLAVWHGFRQLDGMSGDISGFALTVGELAGCAAWALMGG